MHLRTLFGILTLLCLLLVIFRRPLAWVFGIESEGFWHCFCAPWYYDMYLLGFDSYWPFEGDCRNVGIEDRSTDFYVGVGTTGMVVWVIAHIAVSVIAWLWFYWLFFKQQFG